jgi:1,4-dihydroxy-2-naphthoyl-CoA hydrolase
VSGVDLELWRKRGEALFPGFVGIEVSELERGRALGALRLEEHHVAPNGYVHAGAIVSLADTVCGYGCIASLPEGRTNFTTIELKTNFVAPVRSVSISCEGRLAHGGRTTQVWDATVAGEDGKPVALFRCTQLLL